MLRFARNDVDIVSHTTSFSRREAPEVCIYLSPQKTEGVGNAGCPLHPRPRVRLV